MIDADLVLAGNGSQPNIEIAEASSIICDNGTCIDHACLTSASEFMLQETVPVFFAMESESGWNHSKMLQTRVAWLPDLYWVITLTMPYHDFGPSSTIAWRKLQVWVRDHFVVRPGNKEGSQSIWYCADDELIAIDAVNYTRFHALGRHVREGFIRIQKLLRTRIQI